MPLEGAPRILGFLYGIILTLVVPYLLHKSRFPVRVRIVFLTGSLLSGILLFAPMTPLFFPASLYQMKEFDAAVPVIIAVFSFFVIGTLLLGRSFCGYACPIGAIQELPYFIPIKKWKFRQSGLLLVVRGILIAVFIVLAFMMVIHLFFLNLILMRGVRDVFFFGGLSIPAFLFLALVVLSAKFYRPFCRFACPYGALMSLAAWRSHFRVVKTTACIECEKCNDACPTGEILPGHEGNECYLCGRCIDVCPVQGGMIYSRRRNNR